MMVHGEDEGWRSLLVPILVTFPVGVPSCKTPEMQHFCIGLDAMVVAESLVVVGYASWFQIGSS
jgi:hypothetical protein